MTARWRKVRSDLLSNTARSVLAITSLAIGTQAVGAMYLAGNTVSSSFEASFLAANPPSAMLRTTPFPAELVDDVSAHPSVGAAQARRLLPVRATDPAGNSINVELVALGPGVGDQVARIEPTDGAWPPGDESMVVERASLGELGVDIGDAVSATVPGRAPLELLVVGAAFDVYEIAPTLGGPARAYISLDTMAQLTGTTEFDALYLRAAQDPLDREQAIAMTAAVRDDVLAPAGVAIEASEIRDPGEHRGSAAVSFLVRIMQLLSLLALAIAMALVVNTVSALLSQQRRQVGVMKAVGATSGQLTAQYLGYVLALSIVALVVAVPFSLVIGRFLAGFIADLANFDLQPLGIPWATIAFETVIVTMLPLAAVFLAVRRTCRSTVQDAISDRGIAPADPPGRFSPPLSRPSLLAYRNATRNRPRLVLTVVTIGLCGGVLIGVLSTQRSLEQLTDQVAAYRDHDVQLTLTDTVPFEQAAAIVNDDEAVTSVEGWIAGQAFRIRPDGSENENISVVAAPAESTSLRPTLAEGRWFRAGDDNPVVINTHLADEEPDLAVGDDVVLDIEGRRQPWTIVGVSTTTLVGPVAYVPVSDLAAATDRQGEVNLLAVGLELGADPSTAADRLDTVARAAGIPVGDVQTNAQLRASVDDLVDLFTALLLLVGAILAFVAVVGVAGTMTLNVVEQTREIGVLRTLGASSWAVRRHFLVQGLAVAIVGFAVGVVLSLPVAAVLRAAVVNDFIDAPIPTSFSWLGVGIWIVVALVIGALGATRPARVASRLTISDTLAYE